MLLLGAQAVQDAVESFHFFWFDVMKCDGIFRIMIKPKFQIKWFHVFRVPVIIWVFRCTVCVMPSRRKMHESLRTKFISCIIRMNIICSETISDHQIFCRRMNMRSAYSVVSLKQIFLPTSSNLVCSLCNPVLLY